jgi:prepilin-type processing-associated H-X9-DG protein
VGIEQVYMLLRKKTYIILGTVILACVLIAGLLLLFLSDARQKARMISDASNLKCLGFAMRMFSQEYREKFPPDLAYLMEGGYCENGEIYMSPGATTKSPDTPDDIRNGQTDYIYLGYGLNESDPANTVVMHTKPGIFKNYVNVLFLDGHVEGVKTSDFLKTAKANNWIIPPPRKPWHLESPICRKAYISPPKTVDLSDIKEKISDKDLEDLKKLPEIEILKLTKTSITDQGLVNLSALKNLKELHLNKTGINGTGFKYLTELSKLEKLNIVETKFLDENIIYLCQLKQLKWLACNDEISDNGTKQITEGLKDLENFYSSAKTTDTGFSYISSLKNLKEFYPGKNDNITNKGIKYISTLPSLTRIGMSGVNLDDESLEYLGRISSLETIMLSSDKITNEGLKNLSGLNKLSYLCITSPNITEDGRKYLTGLSKLKTFCPHYYKKQ